MQTVRSPRTVAVLVLLLACLARPAAAASGKDAKKIYEEATAAFGLGKYAVAAEKYEAAFAIRPDPALLYNAAQSYRLAGNKPRALELYRNYVRLYPDGSNANDARSHVAALKKEIEDERPPIEMARPPRPGVQPPPGVPAPAPAPLPATGTGGAGGAAAAGDAAARRVGAACARSRSGGRAARARVGERCSDVDQLGRAAG